MMLHCAFTNPFRIRRISETFWMHGGQPSGTYVLTYDGFGRLKDGWHYLYGNPTNVWSERNITYDLNGNIKTLLRYGSSGTTPLNNYSFSYEGNRASMLNNTDYFEYDFNGNVTGDAAREMAIGYNVLNLPSWFNDGQNDLCVFYDYLADGTKVAFHREDTGMGRAWLGDLVFNMEEQVSEPENPEDGSRGNRASTLSKRDTTGKYLKVVKNVNLRGPEEDEEEGAYYSFESTPYAGGRIESIGNGIKVRKFVTDHLGSVRAIVTDNAVVERSDYYPFGGRHDNPSLTTLTSNRYGFIGKERQNISTGLDPYIDFGARFYDPLTARWLSPDPMADKYTSLTQYNYCGGDPVNLVDPDGRDVFTINEQGVVLERTENRQLDVFNIVNSDGVLKATTSFAHTNGFTVKYTVDENNGFGYHMRVLSDNKTAINLFEFLADNTVVEFGLATTDENIALLITNNQKDATNIVSIAKERLDNQKHLTVNTIIHSHPGNSDASVFSANDKKGDRFAAEQYSYSKFTHIDYYIYKPSTKTLQLYDAKGIFPIEIPYSILKW